MEQAVLSAPYLGNARKDTAPDILSPPLFPNPPCYFVNTWPGMLQSGGMPTGLSV
jgi:hypothetical protein